ncbi:MAG: hypothetical protein NT099_00200 [Candidatus Saganbacteria bacterium]|nr:hypothetical protein [Candidatus Saganbacteria bacterium]
MAKKKENKLRKLSADEAIHVCSACRNTERFIEEGYANVKQTIYYRCKEGGGIVGFVDSEEIEAGFSPSHVTCGECGAKVK